MVERWETLRGIVFTGHRLKIPMSSAVARRFLPGPRKSLGRKVERRQGRVLRQCNRRSLLGKSSGDGKMLVIESLRKVWSQGIWGGGKTRSKKGGNTVRGRLSQRNSVEEENDKNGRGRCWGGDRKFVRRERRQGGESWQSGWLNAIRKKL